MSKEDMHQRIKEIGVEVISNLFEDNDFIQYQALVAKINVIQVAATKHPEKYSTKLEKELQSMSSKARTFKEALVAKGFKENQISTAVLVKTSYLYLFHFLQTMT